MFDSAGPSLREQALAQGADAFVAKASLDWIELLAEIRRFVGSPPARPGDGDSERSA
jgi:hypothetical protein